MSDLRITGVSSKLNNELKAIAKNHDVTLSAFLKPKLIELRDSFPERMRKYDKD